MVVVDIPSRHRYLLKVIDAAVTILEPDKGMIIAEQRLQFLWCAADSAVWVSAIFGIAALPGMVNCQHKRVCLLVHFFSPPSVKI